MKKRILSLALCAALTLGLLLTGCSGSSSSFTWKVSSVPANLDPQMANTSQEIIAVTNLYRGLTRMDETNTPVLDCAESYTLSTDGLTYTFVLRSDLSYTKLKKHTKEYELTAKDFVFGLQRTLMPQTNSPYAQLFANIQGAAQVMAGEAPASTLGITAPDDRTVVIRLAQPDADFLSKLASPGAMPCNQEFFEASGGSYGLSAQYTLANGWFYMYNWNENGLFLRRNATGSQIASLRLVLDEESLAASSAAQSGSSSSDSQVTVPSPAQRILDGEASGGIGSVSSAQGLTTIPFTTTTWALVFNTQEPQLSSPAVRQALISSIQQATVNLSADFSVAEGLIPPSVTVQSTSYRQQAGTILPAAVSNVRELCRQGLESSGLTRFDNIQILMPQNQSVQEMVSQLNQQWQQDLGAFSAYFSLKQVTQQELEQALQTGSYQIALVPLTSTSNSAAAMLKTFAAGAWTGLVDSTFDQAMEGVNSASQTAAGQISACEKLLMDQYSVYPLWYEQQALLLAPNIKGVVFNPFGPVLDLTWATATD